MPVSVTPNAYENLEHLPRTPASDVKKLGWRGVMRAIKLGGKVVVTNHNEPEAVIIAVDEYEAMLRIVRQAETNTASVLDALRQSFDERLMVLQAPDAGDRLRSVMRAPAKLGGKVKAGASY
ncbi:MAG TPA: type II toxin-antitoxin system prevent-host-death family antitoxin [Rudaea sp.]|jgi:prevent-host-death family protein